MLVGSTEGSIIARNQHPYRITLAGYGLFHGLKKRSPALNFYTSVPTGAALSSPAEQDRKRNDHPCGWSFPFLARCTEKDIIINYFSTVSISALLITFEVYEFSPSLPL